MASDRGTLSRGAGPAADHTMSAAPTTPAGRRLPSAPRERRPALAALAVLLIIGGALASAALVLESGKRVTAIEISQSITAGEPIPPGAMKPVQVASGTSLQYLPWSDEKQAARSFAATNIPAGTLLTNGLIATSGNSIAGKILVGLALKDGQMPSGLAAGDSVAIYAVSNSGGGSTGCPATVGSLLTNGAVVQKVAGANNASNSGTTDVTVAVSPGDVGKVSCSASAGGAAIAKVPPGTSPGSAGGSGLQQGQAGTAPGTGSSAGSGASTQPSSPGRTKKKSPAPGTGIG